MADVDGVLHCYEDGHDVESSHRVKANPRSKDKREVKITRNLCAKKKSVTPNRNSVERIYSSRKEGELKSLPDEKSLT